MSHAWRLPATAESLGKILLFPVRCDPLGQIELFPEPPGPDPHSATQLVIQFTLLQMRVTRISSYLGATDRFRLFAELHQVLNTVESLEAHVARLQLLEAQNLKSRIA